MICAVHKGHKQENLPSYTYLPTYLRWFWKMLSEVYMLERLMPHADDEEEVIRKRSRDAILLDVG